MLINYLKFPCEDFYVKEIEYFFDCIEGRKINVNTVMDAYRTLEIALTGEITGK